jgi:NADH:ubiquinone oxidoreductase subunit 6 (subunit J)
MLHALVTGFVSVVDFTALVCAIGLPLIFWAAMDDNERAKRGKALPYLRTAVVIIIVVLGAAYYIYRLNPGGAGYIGSPLD